MHNTSLANKHNITGKTDLYAEVVESLGQIIVMTINYDLTKASVVLSDSTKSLISFWSALLLVDYHRQ